MLTQPNPNNIHSQQKGVVDMLRPKKVWITYKPHLKRWEVGLYWHGKAERFYQIKGYPLYTEELANELAGDIRSDL